MTKVPEAENKVAGTSVMGAGHVDGIGFGAGHYRGG